MSAADMTAQLDSLAARLPESGASYDSRTAALGRFRDIGLPGRRIETWRYTDLSSLAEKDFAYLPAPPDRAVTAAARELIDGIVAADGRPRLVFIDGHFSDSLSAIDEVPGLKLRVGAPPANEDRGSALAALNTAFAVGGAALRFSADVADPIELVSVAAGRNCAPQLRLRIELDTNVRATIIQRFVDLPDAGDAWLNLLTDVELGSGSELTLYRLQTHRRQHFQTALNRVRIAENANLAAGNIELGGKLVRNEFEIALDGEGAGADVYSLSLTGHGQHADTRIAIDHRAPRTTSRQNHRAILAGDSRAVFNGRVVVRQHAQQIDARQRSDSLLLSPRAEADIKPELEIYADQVICSHGATIGELSEDALFYLRARGIDAPAARGILTTAFADALLGRIELEPLREQARAAVVEQLPREIEST